jgi:hypothetical protein
VMCEGCVEDESRERDRRERGCVVRVRDCRRARRDVGVGERRFCSCRRKGERVVSFCS